MVLYKEGMNLYYNKEYEKASELFLELLKQDQEHHKAWNALGVCFKKLHDNEKAKQCFENAISLFPDSSVYKRNLQLIEMDQFEKQLDDSENSKTKNNIKIRTYHPEKTDVVCLFMGLFLICVYLFSVMLNSGVPSPVREYLGLGGVLFFLFFISTNLFKMLALIKIPVRLVVFIGLIILLVILFVKFIFEEHTS